MFIGNPRGMTFIHAARDLLPQGRLMGQLELKSNGEDFIPRHYFLIPQIAPFTAAAASKLRAIL